MCLYFYRQNRPSHDSGLLDTRSSSDSDTYSEKYRTAKTPESPVEALPTDRTLPPYSLQDFMHYLLHIAHHAENFQFYLWLRDYTARFSAAPAHARALSPPWVPARKDAYTDSRSPIWEKAKGWRRDLKVDFDIKVMEVSPISEKGVFREGNASPTGNTADDAAWDARNQKGLKWQPFTIQPFRGEIDNIIALYLTPNSPRELNLSERDRIACLHALQHTTHPSAFAIPMRDTTDTLITYSYPNFIRWAEANASRPRQRRKHGFYKALTTAMKGKLQHPVGDNKFSSQDEVNHFWRR